MRGKKITYTEKDQEAIRALPEHGVNGKGCCSKRIKHLKADCGNGYILDVAVGLFAAGPGAPIYRAIHPDDDSVILVIYNSSKTFPWSKIRLSHLIALEDTILWMMFSGMLIRATGKNGKDSGKSISESSWVPFEIDSLFSTRYGTVEERLKAFYGFFKPWAIASYMRSYGKLPEYDEKGRSAQFARYLDNRPYGPDGGQILTQSDHKKSAKLVAELGRLFVERDLRGTLFVVCKTEEEKLLKKEIENIFDMESFLRGRRGP